MKVSYIVSAIALLSTTEAFASKARLEALQKAAFAKDVQTTFVNPAHVNSIGNLLTVEFGGKTNSAAPKAEGGIFDNNFGANVGIYLGHLSENQKTQRSVNGFENQNNPIEIFYGKGVYGASLALSNYNDKTSKVKEQSVTARFGYDNNGTEIYGSIEALQKAENGTDKFEGGPQVSLGYEQEFGTNYFFANLDWGTGENKMAAGKTDSNILGVEVGALSRRIESVYYGTSLAYAKLKTQKSISALTLPIFIGIERNITSWAVVRASISQSVLISQTKDENQTAPANQKIVNKNDTTVAAGLGIKYEKFTLDGVVSGSTTGDINGNAVLSQASLTYQF